MQFERLRARNAVSVARESGTSVNRFEERSSECKTFASGARLAAAMEVSELSDRLRCLRNLHFDAGTIPMLKRFDELPARYGPLD